MENEKKPVRSRTSEMMIGKVKYIVTTHYNENGRETAEQKLLRIVSNRVAEEMKRPENAVI
jgi:hypothetical protein